MRTFISVAGLAAVCLFLGAGAGASVDIQAGGTSVSVSGGNVDVDAGGTRVNTQGGDVDIDTGKAAGGAVRVKAGKGKQHVHARSGANSLNISGDGKIEIHTPGGSLVINGQIGRVNAHKASHKVVINEIEPVAYNFEGNDDHVLKNKYIETSGIAVTIGENSSVTIVNCLIKADTALKLSGNCEVKIIGCTIIGNMIAITAEDNSTVTITDSAVTGDEQALAAAGNSTITVSGSSVTGALAKDDNGDIEDEGNNEFSE